MLPKDNVEAVTWYRKAANQGHAEAQGQLGVMYANGLGVTQNNVEAVAWYCSRQRRAGGSKGAG